MPSYKYGARTFFISVPQQLSSTAASVVLGQFQYIPGSQAGLSDFAPENIKAATLVFGGNISSAATTAAGGSMIIAATQYNSAGASQNSAALYTQSAASQAAHVPIDVSSLVNWTLSPGDTVVLGANSNTVGVPTFSSVVFSATVDTVTAI